MQAFATLVGMYNATAITLADADYGHIALDAKSRVLLSHGSSSMQIGNGNETTPIFLSMLTEDEAAGGGEVGIMSFAVRQDTLASLVSTDGDYSALSVDALGALYVHDVSTYAEDTAHSSGDYGQMALAVRKDAEGSLCGTDGDYAPLQVDALGRLRTTAEVDLTPGTAADKGADEAGDGEVPSVGVADWVDVSSISLLTGKLLVCAIDGTADKQTQFQLIVDVSGTATRTIRKFAVTESAPSFQVVFPRVVEVAGAANTSVKLQAKRLRGGAVDANVSGGINAYTL